MTDPTPCLADAYAIRSPDDNRRVYAAWAASYDTGFAAGMGYRLPGLVADAYAMAGGTGPVLDLGAGTGLVAAALARHRIGPVDATDISAEMLAQARAKGLYRALFVADAGAALPLGNGSFSGVVSAGTFTHGHLGPAALAEVLRIIAPGGLAVLSINAGHYAAQGFADALAALSARFTLRHQTTEAIYARTADHAHAADTAVIVTLRRV